MFIHSKEEIVHCTLGIEKMDYIETCLNQGGVLRAASIIRGLHVKLDFECSMNQREGSGLLPGKYILCGAFVADISWHRPSQFSILRSRSHQQGSEKSLRPLDYVRCFCQHVLHNLSTFQ